MGTHDALIVDDDRRYLAACGRLVRRRGFNAILSPTFRSAELAVATESPPEAILIDVTLDSGNSGIALRDSILALHNGKSCVALMSAYPLPFGCGAIEKSATKKIHEFLIQAAILRITRFHPVMSLPVIKFSKQHSLSPQEARIAAELFIGTTRTNLSECLGLSENTVKSQVRQLLRRVNASSVDEMVGELLRFSYELTRTASLTIDSLADQSSLLVDATCRNVDT